MANRDKSNSCDFTILTTRSKYLKEDDPDSPMINKNLFENEICLNISKKPQKNQLKETRQKCNERQCFSNCNDLKLTCKTTIERNKLAMIFNTNKRYQSGKCPICNNKIQQYKLSIENSMFLCTNDSCTFPFDQEYNVFDDLTSFDLVRYANPRNIKNDKKIRHGNLHRVDSFMPNYDPLQFIKEETEEDYMFKETPLKNITSSRDYDESESTRREGSCEYDSRLNVISLNLISSEFFSNNL